MANSNSATTTRQQQQQQQQQQRPAKNEAPPIVHALGGSIGSALALLLLYPLERARIELQSRAAVEDEASEQSSCSCSSESPLTRPHERLEAGAIVVSPIRNLPTPTRSYPYPSGDDKHNNNNNNDDDDDDDDGVGESSGIMAIEEEESWDRAAAVDSPSSWSMNSCSNDGRSFSSIRFGEENSDDKSNGENDNKSDRNNNTDNSIAKCLLDLREQGVLYKGVKPIISTIFTSQFVFFFLHASAKRWLARVASSSSSSSSSTDNSSSSSSSPALSLLSSCLAGVGNVLLTNPLWVTNMAIVSGSTETQNLFRECWKLWKTRGPRQLWKGTDASLLLVSNPIIQFVCYEQFKRMLLSSKAARRRRRRGANNASANANASASASANINANSNATLALGAAEAFVLAALAKAIATVSTYPLQLTQTLLRMSNNNNNNNNRGTAAAGEQLPSRKQKQQYEGTIDCLIQLYRANNAGCKAWFRGMRAKLLQTVLTAAFTFLTYEQILGVVQNVAMYTVRMRQQQRQHRIESGRRNVGR